MMYSLTELPPELLNEIVAHFRTANTLCSLSQTCKQLHKYTHANGFRVFLNSRFPSIETPPRWKDAAHALPTLSRAWDRKAFRARILRPPKDTITLTLPNIRSTDGMPPIPLRYQTMGYQPVIDCYEEWTGSSWTSRREVVAWGAGVDLVIRAKDMDGKARLLSSGGKWPKVDHQGHGYSYMRLNEDGHVNGKDDITSLNLLRSKQLHELGSTHAIIGRASSALKHISISEKEATASILTTFETKGRSVRSANVSGSSEPLLAACLSDGALALYKIRSDGPYTSNCIEIAVIPEGEPVRTWSARFLRHDRLAIGLGKSKQPLHIYDVSYQTFSNEALRKFDSEGGEDSVYSIAPIGPSSQAGGAEGDLFLSGWYSGHIGLHDMRSPERAVHWYFDSTNEGSAIYSLLPFGRERFVAGGAMHSMIKVFDLRMAGGKAYYSVDAEDCCDETTREPPDLAEEDECCDYHLENIYKRRNYNIYVDHRNSFSHGKPESPVYSLAASSSFAPTFYVGLENNVAQMDLVGMMDKYPDPIFKHSSHAASKAVAVKAKYDPTSDVLGLGLLEHSDSNSRIQLRKQIQAGVLNRGILPGWDERWVETGRNRSRWR